MRKNILNRLAVVLCLITVFGCRSKKHLLVDRKPDTATVVKTDSTGKTTSVTTTTTTSVAASTAVAATKPAVIKKTPVDSYKLDKLRAIRLKQVDFNTFSGKAQTKLTIDGSSHDVTMNVRIQKNQQIWVSITAVLGVEVARALITPDSIKVMNRLESTYLKKPFSFIYGYTSKHLNYKTLESLLIGNAVPDLLRDDTTIKPDNGNTVVNGNLEELVYQLNIGADLRVSRTAMSNSAASQSMQIDNSSFIQVGTRVVPSQINISSASGSKKIQADLHYNKAEFDQALTYPFSVPARFSIVK
jgi:predicted secreted protein